MLDICLPHAGAIRVWSWCCGAPRRTRSLSSSRTLSRDSSVNSSRCADRPRLPSPSPYPPIKARTNTPSAPSPALPPPPAPQRRTWSYRLGSAGLKLTFSSVRCGGFSPKKPSEPSVLQHATYGAMSRIANCMFPFVWGVKTVFRLWDNRVLLLMSQGPHYYYYFYPHHRARFLTSLST